MIDLRPSPANLSCQASTEEQTNSFTLIALDQEVPDIPQKPPNKQSSGIFGSTFLTIFLAEFGDKTQLSTLLMSAQSQSPWVVFLGSAAALITTSLLGVLLGRWLANRLAPRTMQKLTGVSLLLIAAMLLWDVVQL